MKCLAPSLDVLEERCQNASEAGDHCRNHQTLLNPRYKQYKIICNVAKALHVQLLESQETNELLKLYSVCNSAYLCRESYRKDAYMPEYWDIGHGHQIHLFQDLMYDCEKRLSKIFEKLTPQNMHSFPQTPEGEQIKSDLTPEGEQSNPESGLSIDFIEQVQIKRKRIQEDFNKLLKQFTSQDQKHYFRMKRIAFRQMRIIEQHTTHFRALSLLYLSFMSYYLCPGFKYSISVPIETPFDWIMGCGQEIFELVAERLNQLGTDDMITKTLQEFDKIIPASAKTLLVKVLCFFKEDKYILSMNLGNRYIATVMDAKGLDFGARQRTNVIVGTHTFKIERIGLPRIEDTKRVKRVKRAIKGKRR